MSLGTGLGRLAGRVFRIGHLGDFNDLMLAGTLAGVEMGLAASAIAPTRAAWSQRSTISPPRRRRRPGERRLSGPAGSRPGRGMDAVGAARLLDLLAAGGGIVAAVGAGGKKSTLYRLAEAHRLVGSARIGLTCTVSMGASPRA